jgi:hypothetical protein
MFKIQMTETSSAPWSVGGGRKVKSWEKHPRSKGRVF